MRFDARQSLVYGTLEAGSWQIMFMSYEVIGSTLVTNQPSSPAAHETEFAVTQDGNLSLSFGGVECEFRRIDGLSFEEALRSAQH